MTSPGIVARPRLLARSRNASGPPFMIDGPSGESKEDPNDVHAPWPRPTVQAAWLPAG